LAIGKTGGFHRISFKSNNLEILLLSHIKGWGYYQAVYLRQGHPKGVATQAVRATFFIDPKGILRAMVYYPMSNGRSINEFVRLLQAMQTSDKNSVATPEGWTPGCDVIVPPPKTSEAADKRTSEGYNTVDWYYSTKKL
jgi:peroxiredoxin (alkyl hydroperoxide reductase subunit C)